MTCEFSWLNSVAPFICAVSRLVDGSYDVAVLGCGFLGLAAAVQLDANA